MILARATDPAAIVAAAYPPRLADLTAESVTAGFRAGERKQSYAEFEQAGERVLFAAYTNQEFGRVRALVLTPEGDVSRIVEPDLTMHGRQPLVTLRDLNADGTPEVVARFEDDRGMSTWLFAWSEGGLRFLSADPDDPAETALVSPQFLDLDGDGILEILDEAMGDRDHDGTPATVNTLYRRSDGNYVPAAHIEFWREYTRRTGAPEAKTDTFDAPADAPAHKATLWIVNGGFTNVRVPSAKIDLNGATVVAPSQLNETVRGLQVPVTLTEKNTITVRVTGDPKAQLAIFIARPL